MTHRRLLLAVTIAAGLGAPVASSPSAAQSVNETLPGGVEHRPGGDATTRSVSPGALRAPPPAPTTAKPPAAVESKAAPANKKKSKKAAPATRSAPPVMERAPSMDAPSPAAPRSDGVPRPMRPDESIPGGAERSPGNAQ